MPNKKSTAKAEKKAVEKIVFNSLSAAELQTKANKLRVDINKTGLEIKIRRLRNVRAKYNLRKQLAKVLTALSAKIADEHEKS